MDDPKIWVERSEVESIVEDWAFSWFDVSFEAVRMANLTKALADKGYKIIKEA